ncbi:BamA/TamA family outer membrane protein [Vibrio sp. SCSIO 43136]|uniref:BamA/TamA family outer membrane protein n=1 Tax=Vibrio sp. SCSIO 43136 TaxID=2819101 RepID=UPI002075F37E|nr:BamA/TamA family outer membrane protein [Vibrio sp. SCSIO 43136]USD65047.1 BamA/TamA family outer membrane protein [Vibrio sp. SCSIO 43136]
MVSHFNRWAAISLCCVATTTQAARNNWYDWFEDSAAVPFAFSTDTLGTTVGAAGLIKGLIQETDGFVISGLSSSKGTTITYVNYNNFRIGDSILLSMDAYNAKYAGYDYFIGDSGSNDSSFDQAITTDGEEDRYRLTMEYVLPFGAVAKNGIQQAKRPTREITGSDPSESGVSSVIVEPFYHRRILDVPEAADIPESTWGVKLGYEWDNRNDVRNPSQGSKTNFDLTYSPSTSDGSQWVVVEADHSRHYDLGAWEGVFSSQVLSLDAYLADTPTWNQCDQEICHRPPEYAGVTLGGLYRLRGYSGERYHGRSAVHYSVEYRVMPEWQPLGSWPVFNWYDVPWWQFVAFIDAGRVADELNLKTLHTDMKWNAGGGIRFQVEGIVVRTEIAAGSEEGLFRVMVNQPF